MATLVTGGTGFIGSNIVRELAQRGHQVISVDIVEPDDLAIRYMGALSNQITWVQEDILDKIALSKISENQTITKIIHAAVYTGIREDIERDDSRRIVDINLMGTTNMLDMAKELSVERFVYVSSGGVYEGLDASEGLMRENVALSPHSLYNATKYASELLTSRYGELHGFETASVRLGGPYGPMERVTGHRAVMSILQVWTGKAVRREPIEAVIGGVWDFTYVLDIAAGICTVMDAPHLPHPVYNLNRGVQVTSDELMDAFIQACPSVRFVGPETEEAMFAQPSNRRGVMDSSRIKEDLGFSCQYDMVSGLSAYIRWREEFGFTTR